MEALKNKKILSNYKDVYELNKLLYSNLAVLFTGSALYCIYYLNQAKFENMVYGFFDINAISLLSSMVVVVLYVILFAISLMSLGEKKTRNIFMVSSAFVVCIFIESANHLFLISSIRDSSTISINVTNVLAILERIVFLIAVFLLILKKGEVESKMKNRVLLRYVVPIMFVLLAATMKPFAELNAGFFSGSYTSEMILIMVQLGLSTVPLFLISIALHNGKDDVGSGKDLQVDLICVLILFVIAQIVMVNSSYNSRMDSLVFQFYRILSIAVMVRALYRKIILSVKLNSTREESQLRLYVEKLNKVVDRTTQEMREKNQIVLNELEYAKVIQQSLLPSGLIGTPGKCVFETGYFPCERLSGDFYDIFPIDDENYVMYIMDVSGHGISAALLTMVSNNLLSVSKRNVKKKHWALNPSGTVQYLYEEFNKLGLPDEVHLVIFYGVYNINTREFSYSTGGINCFPAIIKEDGRCDFLNLSNGFPICKMGDFYVPTYTTASVVLEESDTLIFYTDGLIDFEKNRLFNQESLIRFLTHNRQLPLFELNELLKSIITPKAEGFNDDITYFMMRI